MDQQLFQWIIGLAQLFIGGILSWGIKILWAINSNLSSLNANQKAMKQWQIDHEKQDDERNLRLEKQIESLGSRPF